MGKTSAILRYLGNVPCKTHKLNKSLKGADIIILLYLMNLVSKSNPRSAFLLLCSLIINSTRLGLDSSKSNELLQFRDKSFTFQVFCFNDNRHFFWLCRQNN